MSSDSDSDICDFTSNIGKQMSKGLNQFWNDFDKVIDEKSTAENISSIDDKRNLRSTGSINKLANETKTQVLTTTFCDEGEGSTSKQCKDESESNLLVPNEPDVKILDTNVQNRITNKLNELSAEIETILKGKNSKKRRTKRTSTRRYQPSRRRQQQYNTQTTVHPVADLNNSITLSSDDESQRNVNLIKEELNPIVTVNVLWKSVKKNSFKVYKYQALNCISEHYCEKYHVNSKLLFFTLDEKHVKLEENSFVSLRLDDGRQIEGSVLPEQYLNNSQEPTTLPDVEPLKFKVQYNNRKKSTIDVGCHESDKMEIIFWKVSKCTGQSVENIKIYFDGHIIKPSAKICEMGLENGDCFDLEIANVPVETK